MSTLAPPLDARTRVITATAGLLRAHGADAVTTRRVAELAGLQAPAIYRLFGDKDGLLEAVAEYVLAEFVTAKTIDAETATTSGTDPIEDLRVGWEQHIEFGLENPALFRLLSDPARYTGSPAAQSGREVLAMRVHRVARAGRLRVPEDRAIALIQAAGIGVVTTLLSVTPGDRDTGLSTAALDAVLTGILTEGVRHEEAPVSALIAVRALAPDLPGLTDPERSLLGEWIDRALAAGSSVEDARTNVRG